MNAERSPVAPVVGVVGVGKIGQAVAEVVFSLGMPTVLYNRTRAKAEVCAADDNALVASTPRELAESADIIVSCLADPGAINDCYFGENGLLAGLRPDTTFVELATLAPAHVADIAREVEDAAGQFLYATVTGRPAELRDGKGYLLVSGSSTAKERADVLLSKLGNVRYLGSDPTHAAVMKLMVNLCVFSSIGSTAEALALATRSNLDAELAYDILLESPVSSPYLRLRREAFLHPNGTPPVTATMSTAVGNYELIMQLAEATGAILAQSEATRDMMIAACDAGYVDRDGTSLVSFVRGLSNATAD